MNKALISLAIFAAFGVQAQQTADITGDAAQVDQQNIGDSTTNQNDINSQSTQLGNSANANGAAITTNVDTRDQNTFNPTADTKSYATGGSAHGNKSDNDNRSSVGNTSSSSGGNSLHGTNKSDNTNTAAAKQGQDQGQGQSSSNALALKSNNSLSNGSASTSQGGTGGTGGTSSAQGGTSTAQTGASTSQGGNSTSQGGASGGNVLGLDSSGGNSTTNVDASDNSVSRSVAWAPVSHGPAAPALAAANLVVSNDTCGPRVVIVRRPIEGVRFGVWGGQSAVQQGYDEVAHEAEPAFVQQGENLMGHKVTTYTAVVGTSSGGSLSLGGFGRSGDGAQGGGSTTGAMQQVVQRVTVRACVFAQEKPVVVTPVAAPVVLPVGLPIIAPPAMTPAPLPAPKRVIRRAAPKVVVCEKP
jgi:hypothetical protein